MKTKIKKEKSYLNKLYENFAKNIDINLLFFIVAGLISYLSQNEIIDWGFYPPLIIYTYLLLKIFWFDIPSNNENEN